MNDSIQSSITGLWEAIISKLTEALKTEQEGASFFEWQSFDVQRTNKAVVSLDRAVAFERVAIREILGTLTVQFGCMVRSGETSRGKEEAEVLSYWLADLFLSAPFLNGVSRDARVESIQLDAEPPVGDESPSQWVTVTVAWEFGFSRP